MTVCFGGGLFGGLGGEAPSKEGEVLAPYVPCHTTTATRVVMVLCVVSDPAHH